MTTFTHTASQALQHVHDTSPPGTTRLVRGADNTRGEVDALGIAHGGEVLIMHGATLVEGPAYYVWITATVDPYGRYVPNGAATHGDSYDEALSAASEWVSRRTFATARALRRDGGER